MRAIQSYMRTRSDVHTQLPTEPPMPIRTLMRAPVRAVPPTAVLSKALGLMVKHQIGSVVVVKAHKPVGIVTERDIVHAMMRGEDARKTPVAKVMHQPLITIQPEASAWEAVRLMLRARIRRLPVVKQGRLLGMVTQRDLFRWLTRVAVKEELPADIREIVEKGYP